MDFIIGLTKSKGKSVIMVVVNKINMYECFCALSHPFKANIVTTTFMEMVQKIHENPNIIVSDIDTIFTRKFLTKLFSCLGT